MKEAHGNLWNFEGAQATVITTNGTTKANGRAIMGRGCAKQALQRYPNLDAFLGVCIYERGNHVHTLIHNTEHDWHLMSFPVKDHWSETADMDLILHSARELIEIADRRFWKRIIMPRPGCGNGRLSWAAVKPVLAPILDDRFTVVTF